MSVEDDIRRVPFFVIFPSLPEFLPQTFVLGARFVVLQNCASRCEGSAYFGTEYSNEVRGVATMILFSEGGWRYLR